MRVSKKIKIENIAETKKALFNWSKQFEEVVWLDSNEHRDKYSSYEAVLAVDAFTAIQTKSEDAFARLHDYQQATADWIFGYLSYDLKNDVEDLTSANFDGLDFPDLYFFQPKKLFLLKEQELEVHYLSMVDDELEEDLELIFQKGHFEPLFSAETALKLIPRISKNEYLEKAEKMLQHIHRGDIYEANFCQEFYSEGEIEPFYTYNRLNSLSKSPFACFFRNNIHYLLSASPERYLKKEGGKIISQPIKGTAPRMHHDRKKDQKMAFQLQNDSKERAENIMIVDLVRNDLSRTAKKGSVEVSELCEVHSFEQVHQLISTVKSEIAEGIPPVEVLRTSFPMGSMTGAPKISALRIIEDLEETKRGLYSGAVGYFDAQGNFDFNVVIRSILYNSQRKYVSLSVGSAITAKSNLESEYAECLIKAKALKQVLEEPAQ